MHYIRSPFVQLNGSIISMASMASKSTAAWVLALWRNRLVVYGSTLAEAYLGVYLGSRYTIFTKAGRQAGRQASKGASSWAVVRHQ